MERMVERREPHREKEKKNKEENEGENEKRTVLLLVFRYMVNRALDWGFKCVECEGKRVNNFSFFLRVYK